MDADIKDAVITVPAYFGMDQKGATKEAGEAAGLNVLMVMNEPTAAALAFALNQLGKQQTVFVFDLGGGTFDVTILSINGNEIDMVASDGDAELGGKDWDDELLEHCVNIFKEKYGSDPQDDPQSYQDCYDRVVRGKISLSTKPKANIQISNLGNRENVQVTREKFENPHDPSTATMQGPVRFGFKKSKYDLAGHRHNAPGRGLNVHAHG